MATLEILQYPDTRLAQKAEAVSDINGALQARIDDLIETLYGAPGLGLAAPQVGTSLRLFVYDLSVRETDRTTRLGPVVLINPEIVAMEGEEIGDEGCLSIPGYFEKVRRALRVQIVGMDREGKEVRIEGEGLSARLFQHEIDHLNGVLMIERFSSLKRGIFLRKFRKQMREEALP